MKRTGLPHSLVIVVAGSLVWPVIVTGASAKNVACVAERIRVRVSCTEIDKPETLQLTDKIKCKSTDDPIIYITYTEHNRVDLDKHINVSIVPTGIGKPESAIPLYNIKDENAILPSITRLPNIKRNGEQIVAFNAIPNGRKSEKAVEVSFLAESTLNTKLGDRAGECLNYKQDFVVERN